MLVAASPLIKVEPGLMIWTLVCFAITLFVLWKYAFGPIQKMIDALCAYPADFEVKALALEPAPKKT